LRISNKTHIAVAPARAPDALFLSLHNNTSAAEERLQIGSILYYKSKHDYHFSPLFELSCPRISSQTLLSTIATLKPS
jgi:hypothetical protein